jgi:hypothetical protein
MLLWHTKGLGKKKHLVAQIYNEDAVNLYNANLLLSIIF